MKKYYRSRFILGAMLAFIILMVLAVAGIWLYSYLQMEQETDSFLASRVSRSQDRERTFSPSSAPAMFGYRPGRRNSPSGFWEVTVSADGSITEIRQQGIPDETDTDIRAWVLQAFEQKSLSGKTGSYKYAARYLEDGSARMVLLDISIQLQSLYSVLRSALVIGSLLLAALFLILLPVSSRVADVFIRSAEKQQQFVTDAGHDRKTPVAIIRSNLEVMELLEGKNKWSDNIHEQVGRLEHLISQFLLMARLEEGHTEKKDLVDLPAVIREELQNYHTGLSQRGIRSSLELPEHLQIRADEKSVRQMLCLLLDNLSAYASDGGEASVQLYEKKKRAVLVLSNTVEHLPEQKPEALTERFVRGTTARTEKTGGAGIGLSAVKRIAEAHGGKLTVSYPDEHRFSAAVELSDVIHQV